MHEPRTEAGLGEKRKAMNYFPSDLVHTGWHGALGKSITTLAHEIKVGKTEGIQEAYPCQNPFKDLLTDESSAAVNDSFQV